MSRLRIVSKSGNVDVIAAPDSELDVTGGTLTLEADGTHFVTAGSKNLEVRCPPGADLIVGTISGSVHVRGPVGATRVVSKSGSIEIDDATEVDARTHSGRVTVHECAGQCRVVVTSGTIRVGRSGHASVAGVSGSIRVDDTDAADVKNISGSIEVGCSCEGRVAIRSVSGKVEVTVPPACAPATHLKSISGKIRNAATQGSDGEIDVKTVSGTIRVVTK
jgi:DUF4097 and DUF4098 domain-containing protein YvlB